ncbi:MAG: hypothetical protein U0359_39320 [Byssovorax sp.]
MLAGAQNFFHIAVAICNVLRAQVSRALVGLESAREAMTVYDWHDHRDRLDKYLSLFLDVVRLIDGEYLPALLRAYDRASLRELLGPDADVLADISNGLLFVRERVERCTQTSLRVKTPSNPQCRSFTMTTLSVQRDGRGGSVKVREAMVRIAPLSSNLRSLDDCHMTSATNVCHGQVFSAGRTT